MAKVLEGIRVLDCGRYIAGPFCSALLADFGADVIRVDRVGGSEDRYVMPLSEQGDGAFFLQVNRNKRSITLDVESDEARKFSTGCCMRRMWSSPTCRRARSRASVWTTTACAR